MSNISLVLDNLRYSSSQDYQERIPTAVDTNIQTVGNAILSYDPTTNEFINTLINKIGLTLVDMKIAKNKLAIFKKGMLDYGDTIEEIFIEMAKGTDFNPERAETEVFKRVKPNVKTLFHKINAQMMWKVTVQRNQLKRAFQSESSFSRFVSGIVQTIYNGRVFDEYVNMKQLFTECIANKQAVIVPSVSFPTDQTTAKEFVKAIKSVSKGMTYMSDEYNHAKVQTFTETSDQVLLIHKDANIEVSAELLASAFNKGEFDYNTQVVEVDSFGSDENVVAALVDRDWFMVYDVLQETANIYNPEGLYWNYFVHHHQVLSYSLFKNAVFFYSTTAPTA